MAVNPARVNPFVQEYEALCRKHGLFIDTFPEPLCLYDIGVATQDRFRASLDELKEEVEPWL